MHELKKKKNKKPKAKINVLCNRGLCNGWKIIVELLDNRVELLI